MTILDRLLSALGLGGGGGEDESTTEPTVTVEHEADGRNEAAVKGVDVDATSTAGGGAATSDDLPDRPGNDGEADAATGESVEVVKGIGPAYAGKLGAAGVETVADLAAADADDLAERTSLSAKRLGRWIERADERRDA